MNNRNIGGVQAATLVDELSRAGLSHAVIAPGSRSTPLALAFADDPRVRVHVMIDERSAGFLALGIAKASGRPAAIVSTSGSAAAHFHPAVIEADLSATPLLVLTADRPPELRGTGANQTIDQMKLFGSSVRWFAEIGIAEEAPGLARYWRSAAARAWAEALGVPPGPVHLNIPLREPLGPAGVPVAHSGRADERPWTTLVRGPVMPADPVIGALAERLATVERGAVVVGGDPVNGDGLTRLAERLRWPLIAEATTGQRRGPQAISAYEALLRASDWAQSHRPELVIRVGRPHLSKRLLKWLDADVPQILIDPYASWHDPERAVSEIVVGDANATATRLAALVDHRGASTWENEWLSAERTARRAIDEILDQESAPSEPGVARDLCALVPDGALLTVASSMPIRDVDWFSRPREGITYVANRGASGIDGFVSTAIGAGLVHDGPAFALSGDLSLFHDANGFLLDPEGEADLTIVVVNNSGGRIFSFLPQEQFGRHFERLFATPPNRSVEELARFHRCGYMRMEKAEDLKSILLHERREQATRIIEVVTEPTRNRRLHSDLWDSVARLLVT